MKKSIITVLVLCLCLITPVTASAAPYTSYSYNSRIGAVAAPNSFDVDRVVRLQDYGFTALKAAKDFYMSDDGVLYILDSGNNRLIITDSEFSSFTEISQLSGNSEKLTFKDASGIYVRNKESIYIADSGNRRVIEINSRGEILKEITKPTSATFSQTIEFIPNKLAGDAIDNLYVTCTGVYEGAVMFDAAGDFMGYYGAANVNTTSNVLLDYFWKQFMTTEQKDAMSKYVPAELSSLDITPSGFIFSITNSAVNSITGLRESMDTVSKLNPKGKNILKATMTEKAMKFLAEDGKSLRFVDVVADQDLFFYVLDDQLCRVLQYDSDMNLLSAFGGQGFAEGLFRKPSAIEQFDDRLYVLDSEKNSITVLCETKFGSTVREAVTIYQNGSYEAAIEPFTKVLAMDNNYELAYVGIGSALYGQGEYKEAMEYFKKGYDSEKYNQAFAEYRVELIRNNFIYVVIAFVALALAIIFGGIRKRKKGRG
ncbi:MAG: hypothetical protein IKD04_03340 [Clostridia bacterium]|nr:hypothetical protein [Clostridia bacterium]